MIFGAKNYFSRQSKKVDGPISLDRLEFRSDLSVLRSDKIIFGHTLLAFRQRAYERFRHLFLDNHQILQTPAYSPNQIDRKRYIVEFQFYYHLVSDKLSLYL